MARSLADPVRSLPDLCRPMMAIEAIGSDVLQGLACYDKVAEKVWLGGA